MRKKRSFIRIFMTVLVIGIVLGIAAFFGYEAITRREAPVLTEAPTPISTPEPTPTPTPMPTPTPEPTPIPYIPPDDLAMYQRMNSDVIGIIDIPGMDIHYPILLHPTEDNYYLNVTVDGIHSEYPGSIYTNSMEGKDFETFNTVIYGHNMNDGSMFGTLKNYQDPAFMETHREIHIYTPSKELVYTVVANVIYDDRYVTYYYDDNSVIARADYLASLHNDATGTYWMDDAEVTTGSHILTLQTCIGGMPDNRRFIIAVLQEEAQEPFVVVTQ